MDQDRYVPPSASAPMDGFDPVGAHAQYVFGTEDGGDFRSGFVRDQQANLLAQLQAGQDGGLARGVSLDSRTDDAPRAPARWTLRADDINAQVFGRDNGLSFAQKGEAAFLLQAVSNAGYALHPDDPNMNEPGQYGLIDGNHFSFTTGPEMSSAIRHESTHVAQSCQGGGPLGLQIPQAYQSSFNQRLQAFTSRPEAQPGGPLYDAAQQYLQLHDQELEAYYAQETPTMDVLSLVRRCCGVQ